MKHGLKKLEWIALSDLLMLPVYLYAYGTLEMLFWIALILYDSQMLKQLTKADLVSLFDPPHALDTKRMSLFGLFYAIALGIVAFKNLKVAGILLVNELLMTLVAFINLSKEDKK